MNLTGTIQTPIHSEAEGPALSEIARNSNIFFEPSRTFNDINRKSTWWVPFVLICVVGYGFVFAVAYKVGFATVAHNQMLLKPADLAKIEKLPREQQALAWAFIENITKTATYAFSLFYASYVLIGAAVLLGVFNFGMGAKLTYAKVLAILTYSSLPGLLKSVVSIVALFAGLKGEAFMIQNPIGTNPGYYVGFNGSPFMYSFLSSIDLFSIWTVILVGIGVAVVGKVSRGKAILTVGVCWLLLILVQAFLA